MRNYLEPEILSKAQDDTTQAHLNIFKIFLLILCGLFQVVCYSKEIDAPVVIPHYQMTNYQRDIVNFYQQHRNFSHMLLAERLELASALFLNKPYVLGSLGESPIGEFDQQPFYRTDVFDCVTYVEVVLALITSTNFDEFINHILKIRYKDGVFNFVHRNHFTSVDWNPNNQHNGYLIDLTKSLFADHMRTSITIIDRPAWFQHLSEKNLKLLNLPTPSEVIFLVNKLRGLSKEVRKTTSYLDYVPLDELFDKQGKPRTDLFRRIPSGSVIEIVRPNWELKDKIGTNMDISHMGFAIIKQGKLIFREASTVEKKVIDIPLDTYLAGYLSSPTVKGIHIEKIILPASFPPF